VTPDSIKVFIADIFEDTKATIKPDNCNGTAAYIIDCIYFEFFVNCPSDKVLSTGNFGNFNASKISIKILKFQLKIARIFWNTPKPATVGENRNIKYFE
jgi:hypothetical protein